MEDRDTAPIAIVVAIPAEMAHIERRLRGAGAVFDAPEQVGPRAFTRVTYRGMPLVLSLAWIGMVAAGAATEAVIARYAPRAVLNYGCTGAHRDDIYPGDVVVGTDCIAYDHGRLLPGGAFEHTPMRIYVRGQEQRLAAFPTNPPLLALAESVAGLGLWEAERWPAEFFSVGQPDRPPRVFFGPVASADRFTQDADALRALHARHASLCEDMEAAAIAQVCALHDLPFLTVKDISNNEFHATTTFGEGGSFRGLHAELGRRAAAFTFALLERLAASNEQ